MQKDSQNHFKGKTIPEHLKEARTRGALASAEIHGTEISGFGGAFADSLRDTSIALSLFWVILQPILSTKHLVLFSALFLLGWTLWKSARSAFLGFARIERLHRLISEERWEIQNHREQEKEELTEIYKAKGFEEPLLSQVITVLMADDNRLLQVMLEEELGLSLEAHEHPVKQAFGAFLGAFIVGGVAFPAYFIFQEYGFISSCSLLFLLAAFCTAKIERVHVTTALIWNMTIFFLTTTLLYFVQRLLI